MTEMTEGGWQRIGTYRETMAKHAPEGTKAIVEVELISGRIFQPGVIQQLGGGFTAAQTVDPENGEVEVLVFQERDVVHIRCRVVALARKGTEKAPVGFTVGEITGA